MNEHDLIKCYCCHRSMIQERIVDGKEVKMLHPERVITQFYLNNGSRMDVALCVDCNKQDLENPDVHAKIMSNIVDGWKIEQNILLERGMITQEQSDKAMAYHSALEIKFKSHNMDDYQIKARCSSVNN